MNPITQSRFQLLCDNTVRKVHEEVIKELQEEESYREQMYNVVNSDRAYEEFYGIGGIGNIPNFNGTLQYLAPSPGYLDRIEPAEFAAGMEIERKFWNHNLSGKLRDYASMLKKASFRTKEESACSGYANLNSVAFSFMPLHEEGVAIASTAHTTKDTGVSTASGFSNLGTSALDEVSVEATRLLMRGFRGLNGKRLGINPDTLIIPDDLSKTANELNSTTTGLYSAEGTVNVQKNRWKIITWSMLGDYSTTNWIMADSRYIKEFAKWIVNVEDEPANVIDFETKRIKHSLYSSWGYGFIGWQAFYFHQVS